MFARGCVVARAATRLSAPATKRTYASAAAVTQGSSNKLALAALASAAVAVGSLSRRSTAPTCAAAKSYTGQPGTDRERTFIAVKPDGVQRGLVSEVIGRFERKGYKLVALKMIWPTEQMAAEHYDDLKSKPFFGGLVKYFASGPVVAMVWEGPGVILTGRKILGATNPNAADPGTIRGEYCISVGRNAIHGSDGPDSAAHEIGFWFTEKELSNWTRDQDKWIIANN